MHNITRNTIPREVVERLAAIEQEHEVEILAFNANGATGEAAQREIDNLWRRYHPEGRPDNGVTIAFFAGPTGAVYEYYSPWDFFTGVDGAPDTTAPGYPDVLVPGEDSPLNRITVGPNSRVIGAFEPGIIYIGAHIGCLHSSWRQRIQWDDLLFNPLLLTLNPDAIATLMAERQERSFEAFKEYMNGRSEVILRDARRQIAQYERNLRDYATHYANTMRSLAQERTRVDSLQAIVGNDADAMAERFASIAGHPRLEGFWFTGGQLTLMTTPDIRLTHPVSGETRWLGAFRITVNLGDNQVWLFNLNTKRGNRDHPHVNNGGPCWGDAYQLVNKLILDGELYALVDVLVQYLETFNPRDDWGAYAAYWFDRPDEDPALTQDAEPATTAEAVAV